MARIDLRIADLANRITLKTMLEAEGHRIDAGAPDVVFTDDFAVRPGETSAPAIVLLATARDIPAAVAAMREGAYGYILLPFQPGEAGMMVQRALARNDEGSAPVLASLADVEAQHIRDVLRACKNNHSQAARILGIGRNTLWRKLKQDDPGPSSPASKKESP